MRGTYRFADVLHCDNIDHVAEEYCELTDIREGCFGNVEACDYEVPERWAIAGVHARLTEGVAPADCDDPIPVLLEVYCSWVSDAASAPQPHRRLLRERRGAGVAGRKRRIVSRLPIGQQVDAL